MTRENRGAHSRRPKASEERLGSAPVGRNLWCDSRGAISILAAFVLVSVIGVSALALEYGWALLQKNEDQRVADLAAYGGGLVDESASCSRTCSASSCSALSAANNIAALNGVSGATSCVVASPSGDGNNAVQVSITTDVPLYLARVLTSSTTLPVTAGADAEVINDSPACIIALSGSGTGVTVTSAAGITADNCAVASNAAVTVSSASKITTKVIDYGTSYSTSGASSIVPPAGTASVTYSKTTTTDPLATNSEVTGAVARLSTVEALTSPAAPSVSTGANLGFSASTPYSGSVPTGCSPPTHSGANWTLTCASGGTYHFGSLSVSSTATLAFNTGGSAATTYDFSGGITVSSSAGLTTGPGTFNIAQGITVSSASSATFGAGTFDIGPSTSACTDGNTYSLCVESSTSLTIGGPSSFTFGGGVYAGSLATIELGSGTTNTYDIGSTSGGNAAVASSSSKLLFADAQSGTTSFEVNGNVSAASAACLALPDAQEHDINGAIIANSASNTTLGSGIYTVSDYIDDESASGGGGCSGWSGGTADTGVTLVLGAVTTPSSGTCSGMAVCVLSASSEALVAPTSGATAGLAVIGPTSSSNTAGALFESASSGSYSGAIYMPHGQITVSSASSLGGGSSACLELIGAEVTVSSASAIGTTCTGLGGSASGATVSLVK
jgi:hypothetical protein